MLLLVCVFCISLIVPFTVQHFVRLRSCKKCSINKCWLDFYSTYCFRPIQWNWIFFTLRHTSVSRHSGWKALVEKMLQSLGRRDSKGFEMWVYLKRNQKYIQKRFFYHANKEKLCVFIMWEKKTPTRLKSAALFLSFICCSFIQSCWLTAAWRSGRTRELLKMSTLITSTSATLCFGSFSLCRPQPLWIRVRFSLTLIFRANVAPRPSLFWQRMEIVLAHTVNVDYVFSSRQSSQTAGTHCELPHLLCWIACFFGNIYT